MTESNSIRQSFEPLVDFYLAHPGWGADFEMQGLMIEYMGKNYPGVPINKESADPG